MKLFHFHVIGGGAFMTNIVCHFLSAYVSEYSPLTRPPSLDVEERREVENDIFQIKLIALYPSLY